MYRTNPNELREKMTKGIEIPYQSKNRRTGQNYGNRIAIVSTALYIHTSIYRIDKWTYSTNPNEVIAKEIEFLYQSKIQNLEEHAKL